VQGNDVDAHAFEPTLERARELGRAVLATLEANRRRIDDLNVYPVPDGDTGTNLTATVRAVVDALEQSNAGSAAALADELTRAALLGSRGNSGVILSQVIRGFAAVVGAHQTWEADVLARAFRSASDAAYAGVRDPVEGTMLTVIRELAEEAERQHAASPTTPELLGRLVEQGERTVEQTPELLDVLRMAGVVDAGGAGLVEVVRGLLAGVRGDALPKVAVGLEALGVAAIHQELSRYRYCTSFVVEGTGLDSGTLERDLERMGDSLLVVGDTTALKIHVHTDDPDSAIELGRSVGVVGAVEVADMHLQTRQREERLAARAVDPTVVTGVVAVAQGAGNRALFEELGADTVIDGGPTMNPSTAELVDAIERIATPEAIVLPNNGNVILTAEQAVRVASKPAVVVPSRSVAAGLAAIGRLLPTVAAVDNAATMEETLAEISVGEITRASRDAEIDGLRVRSGQWLGLVDDRAVASGDAFDDVALDVVDRMLGSGRTLLTILAGEEQHDLAPLVAAIRARYPALEDLQEHAGGQPHYPLLLLAE
jgi:DAK2 domain fusion protein YloV